MVTLNPKLKAVLIISAKQAVNALLTNSAFMTLTGNWHQWITTRAGWLNIGLLTLSTIAAREALIWLPKIQAWTQSPTPGQ